MLSGSLEIVPTRLQCSVDERPVTVDELQTIVDGQQTIVNSHKMIVRSHKITLDKLQSPVDWFGRAVYITIGCLKTSKTIKFSCLTIKYSLYLLVKYICYETD